MNSTYSAIHNGFPKSIFILATANGDDHRTALFGCRFRYVALRSAYYFLRWPQKIGGAPRIMISMQ